MKSQNSVQNARHDLSKSQSSPTQTFIEQVILHATVSCNTLDQTSERRLFST